MAVRKTMVMKKISLIIAYLTFVECVGIEKLVNNSSRLWIESAT